MFLDWKKHATHVKQSFAKLGKGHPKMLAGYAALESAAAAEALDAKTRELIALAVAAVKAGATESEVAGALATAISLNAGAAYTYSLRALEAVEDAREA